MSREYNLIPLRVYTTLFVIIKKAGERCKVGKIVMQAHNRIRILEREKEHTFY